MPNDRRIHVERARKWGTDSVWVAEWFSSNVTHCKTPEGRKKFEEWLSLVYGDKAPSILAKCDAPPVLKPYRKTEREPGAMVNEHVWNKAAFDLGVSVSALQLFHQFCVTTHVEPPLRNLPHPVKRRGESSIAFLARADAERLKGAKIPPVNWNEMRRIAFSEFDLIRDQMEVWRTRPEIYFDGLLERASSTILNPGFTSDQVFSQSCMDAMRSRLHVAHQQHAGWYLATTLFTDLDSRGLKSSNQVVAAFQKDAQLLGRIVSMLLYVKEIQRSLIGKFEQVMTSSDYLRPYFRRERIDTRGVVLPDWDYIRSHPLKDGTMEFLLVSLFKGHFQDGRDIRYTMPAELSHLLPVLQNPRERMKITSEAYDTVGDLAVVAEFTDAFMNSSFGDALRISVADAIKSGAAKAWHPLLSPFPDAKMILRVPPNALYDSFGEIDQIVKSALHTWLGVVFIIEARPMLDVLIKEKKYEGKFDLLWLNIDTHLWRAAAELERTAGTAAKWFGIVNPLDPNRPVQSELFLKVYEEVIGRPARTAGPSEPIEETPQPASGAASIPSIPVATPQDSIARAPARTETKRKRKTRGQAKNPQTEESHTHEDVPSAAQKAKTNNLPPVSSLNRHNLEILERIMGTEERSGQIRWGDFEKAMAQLGFEVAQSEGSSVRFDPPMRGARPISFHRPHPDSTMTPPIIKWVGARLRRCYGWTAEDFVRPQRPDSKGVAIRSEEAAPAE